MIVMMPLRYSHSMRLCAHKSLAQCSRQVALLGCLVWVILFTSVRPSDSCAEPHLDLMMKLGVNNDICLLECCTSGSPYLACIPAGAYVRDIAAGQLQCG